MSHRMIGCMALTGAAMLAIPAEAQPLTAHASRDDLPRFAPMAR